MFQIVSDLHIETMNGTPSSKDFITPSAPVLIMAGDIGRIRKYNQLKLFLEDVCKNFDIVLYVLGNHEYYKVKDMSDKTMDELYQDMLRIEAGIDNLYLLNRSSVIIGDVCIAGVTLWSQALVKVPPFIVRIKGMGTRKYNTLHQNDVRYIKKMVKYCSKNKLKLLVVSHHCPSYTPIDRWGKRHKKDRFKSLYSTNLDYLLDSGKIHTWVCGHLHINFDYLTKGGTRLVGNQKGKPKDRTTGFSMSKVICV